jgi:hypothetical protein
MQRRFASRLPASAARPLLRSRQPRRALVEQRSGPLESDVLAIESRGKAHSGFGDDAGVATMIPPVTRFVSRTTKQIYATRANLIVLKHHLGRTIAVIAPANQRTVTQTGSRSGGEKPRPNRYR